MAGVVIFATAETRRCSEEPKRIPRSARRVGQRRSGSEPRGRRLSRANAPSRVRAAVLCAARTRRDAPAGGRGWGRGARSSPLLSPRSPPAPHPEARSARRDLTARAEVGGSPGAPGIPAFSGSGARADRDPGPERGPREGPPFLGSWDRTEEEPGRWRRPLSVWRHFRCNYHPDGRGTAYGSFVHWEPKFSGSENRQITSQQSTFVPVLQAPLLHTVTLPSIFITASARLTGKIMRPLPSWWLR
uniref:uncharacterized protein LOC118529283 n=1 Tax=Halichoerus grypus TaxID=9711 RepID=UPI001659B8A0|nr:uncharacterized protein LOC118529283 [Halichoerus grypus]